MTARPILFSAPMVRALLAGTKTQTRRVLKPQPFADGYYEGQVDCTFVPAPASNLAAYARFGAAAVGGGAVRTETFTPRIAVGGRLWVREAWRTHRSWDVGPPRGVIPAAPIWFEADPFEARTGLDVGKLRPSMFMPRWASRLTLTVTEVRVQRLQDISEEDAIAEGIAPEEGYWRDYLMPATQICTSPADSYRTLWDSINGGGSWAANPWVSAVSFDVKKGNIDAR